MAPTKPTIVLIPGSFCSAALLWDAVINQLHNAGYDTLAVELQTVSPPSTAPAKTMADDAAHIHGIAESLANDGKEVLVVMSSYGGIPGTQAVKGLTQKERRKQGGKGESGGVTGLVYVSALLINEGESSNKSFAAAGATALEFSKVSGEYLYLDPVRGAAAIFPELPTEVGEAWVRKMPGHAMGSFGEKMTSTSHYDVPVTYLKCTEDKIVQPAHQQKMIDDFRSVSRSDVSVVEIASSHCPMVRGLHVEKTAEVIMNAAGAGREGP